MLDGYLMTHDNNNSMKKSAAINGNSYDDNCLPPINNEQSGAALNKTNISMISQKSMSQLSNQNAKYGGPEI